MSDVRGGFRIGLLGRGTVGGAFAELLPQQADRIELITGLRPSICGVLTRSSGSFEDILAEADLIVELIGGIEPAREYVLSAMQSGKHCESGDVIVRDVALPDPQPGDLLVTPATGAYGYSLANNYNGVPRPPVIFCRDGEAREVVRRERYEDLMARDVDYVSEEPDRR